MEDKMRHRKGTNPYVDEQWYRDNQCYHYRVCDASDDAADDHDVMQDIEDMFGPIAMGSEYLLGAKASILAAAVACFF